MLYQTLLATLLLAGSYKISECIFPIQIEAHSLQTPISTNSFVLLSHVATRLRSILGSKQKKLCETK